MASSAVIQCNSQDINKENYNYYIVLDVGNLTELC